MSAAERLRQQGKAEGEAAGLAKGRVEGESRGRVATLLKLLTLKFGELPAVTQKRVQAASIEQLDQLAERVLSAETLREVFADKPVRAKAKKKR